MSREERARTASDVAIVGGGIVGLAIGEELARRGASVTVVDPRPGGEASWAAGGMLGLEYEFADDSPLSRFAAESMRLWPAFSARFADTPWADSVRPAPAGTLVPAASEAELSRLRSRFSKPRGRIEWLDAKSAREKEPMLGAIAGAAWLRDDVSANVRAVLLALLSKLRGRVVRERATRIVVEAGGARGVETERGRVDARTVVLAGGAWSSRIPVGPEPVTLLEVFPVRGQMIGFEAKLSHVVRWETGYAVPRGNRVVVGATVEPEAGFEKRVTPEGIALLARSARAVLPSLGAHTHAWAGLRPATSDEMPVLGSVADGLFVAVGHYRNGILLAPATAIALADLVEGKRSSVDVDAFGSRSWIRVNGEKRRIAPGTTVRALLAQMSLERQGIAVARNEEVVRRSEWDTTKLQNEDRVEIIHAVGGG